MKKNIYLLFTILAFGTAVKAQNATPNGDFESWTSTTFDQPSTFTNSNLQTFFRCGGSGGNCIKTTDAYHGNFAIQLTTVSNSTDTCMGYAINAPNPNGNNPCAWQGGIAYTQQPTGIRGYYKSNSMVGDSGGVLVAFRNGTTCLGMYMYKFGGVHNTYTPFEFAFNPPIAGVPDTMIFVAVSSDVFNNIQIPGSMLQLDSISFVGATQQANFNGDFENWQPQTYNKPNSWYLQTNDMGDGVAQTNDMHAGNFAVEISTYQGDRGGNNGGPPAYYVAQAGGISTGYYLNHCNGSNCQRGGQPFTNQIDTLAFYYKYAPSNNDSAQVMVSFKKNGNNVSGFGYQMYGSQSTYQYFEVPFNTMTPIDSVIVQFQSSIWRDSSLAFVGSKLKLDDIHFKSQSTTGIKTYDAALGVKVFPNPSADGTFTISNVQTHDLVRVYDIYGQEVNFTIGRGVDYAKIQVPLPGAYFVYVNAQGKITNLKVIVGGN